MNNNTNSSDVQYSDFIYTIWSELKENQHVLLILVAVFISGLFGLFIVECYNACFLTCQHKKNTIKKCTSSHFDGCDDCDPDIISKQKNKINCK